MNTFEQKRAEQEAKSLQRFRTALAKLNQLSQQFVHGDIDEDTWWTLTTDPMFTKNLLHVFILRNLRERLTPRAKSLR